MATCRVLAFARPSSAFHCPACRGRMRITVAESLPGDLNRVTYRCDRCSIEADRIIAQGDAGSSESNLATTAA